MFIPTYLSFTERESTTAFPRETSIEDNNIYKPIFKCIIMSKRSKIKQLETEAREHIDLSSEVEGITDLLNDHYVNGREIDTDTLYYSRFAVLMVKMGLLKEGPSYLGYTEYVWTPNAQKIYDQLKAEGYYSA